MIIVTRNSASANEYCEGFLFPQGVAVTLDKASQKHRLTGSEKFRAALASGDITIDPGTGALLPADAVEFFDNGFQTAGVSKSVSSFNTLAGVWTLVPHGFTNCVTTWHFLDALGNEISVPVREVGVAGLEVCTSEDLVLSFVVTGE